MRRFIRLLIAITFAAGCLTAISPVAAQDLLGTRMGLPQSSPPVLWPLGMSLESLSPNKLYPNGPQFGLSNTSGGFGMMGSGPVSGVGLAQTSVSVLVREELERPYAYLRRLTDILGAEELRSRALFGTVLGSQFRSELGRTQDRQPEMPGRLYAPIFIQSPDSVLKDRAPTTDAILNTGL